MGGGGGRGGGGKGSGEGGAWSLTGVMVPLRAFVNCGEGGGGTDIDTTL